MIRFFVLFLQLSLFFSVWGSDSQKVIQYTYGKQLLTIQTTEGYYRIGSVGDPAIVQVSFSTDTNSSVAVYAPVQTTTYPFVVVDAGNTIRFSTGVLSLVIAKNPFSIAAYHNGNVKISGLHAFVSGDTTGFRYRLADHERIYGTGARALPLDRRGYRFQSYNQANYGYGMGADFLNYSIPHILSSNNYMVLFDNPARGWFDIGKTRHDRFEFATLGGNNVCYIMAGDNASSMVQKHTWFTGYQPMVPIWALGHLQSRFGYRSRTQTENVVDSMLSAGYPVDAVILDLYWFGPELQDGKMGNLSWDLDQWPEPEEMVQNFKAKGVKTITVSEPFFTLKSQHFGLLDSLNYLGRDARGNSLTMPNFYFGEAGLIDIFNENAANWFWQQYELQKKIGIAGWWCDLGEPEVHPDTMVHTAGIARELHGIYGHEWAALFYKNYAEKYPEERPFVLGRAGYAGSQHYGLIPWSGDVGRTWSGLRAQVPVMLGMGLSGLAFMHSDAGGFAGGVKTPELYTRWMQFAVFTPVFRPHSDPNAEPEPIYYDSDVQKILKRYYALRYRMLPYNYTLAWENHATGEPLARPLFMDYEGHEWTGNDSTYLWGKNLLIAPVMVSGQKSKTIHLPPGAWYNFWTDERYSNTVDYKLSMADIPVFVKGGSFIPLAEPVQSTDFYSTGKLEVHYYFDASVDSSEFVMYVDDGKTPDAWAKNLFETIRFSQRNGNEIAIENHGYEFAGREKERLITFFVHGKKVKQVTINGVKKRAKRFGDSRGFEVKLRKNEKINIQIIK